MPETIKFNRDHDKWIAMEFEKIFETPLSKYIISQDLLDETDIVTAFDLPEFCDAELMTSFNQSCKQALREMFGNEAVKFVIKHLIKVPE